MMEDSKNIDELCKKIEYNFNDKELLMTALSHPSICNFRNKKFKCMNYERLELLGDSVLSLCVLDLLLNYYQNLDEGEISRRKAYLVCTDTLSSIAKEIDIGEHIYMTKGEENMDGRNNNHILENVMEAIIGAIYFDGGLNSSKEFVKKHWLKLIENQVTLKKDPKSRLQEWAQKNKYNIPQYKTIGQTGLDSNPIFSIEVFISDKFPKIIREAKSKKEGEITCAVDLIEYIKDNIDKKI